MLTREASLEFRHLSGTEKVVAAIVMACHVFNSLEHSDRGPRHDAVLLRRDGCKLVTSLRGTPKAPQLVVEECGGVE